MQTGEDGMGGLEHGLWKALGSRGADIRDVGITDKLDDHLYMYHAVLVPGQIHRDRIPTRTGRCPGDHGSAVLPKEELIASNLAISIAAAGPACLLVSATSEASL